MKKILHVINSLDIGGAETLVCNMAKVQIHDNSVEILTLSDLDSPLKEQIVSSRIKYSTLAAHRYSPIILLRILKYIKKADIVHVHLFPSFYWIALASYLVKTIHNQKYIYTVHSSFTRRRNYIFKCIDSILYSRFSIICTISNECKRVFLERFPKFEDKVVVIENGIDTNAIDAAVALDREKLKIREDEVVLLQVANFREQKDQVCLVRALNLLPENYIAVFVGEGYTKPRCEKLATELGIIHRCKFLGSRSDVPRLLKIADVVVMSSKWEGFGLAAAEGMYAGVPVIASNVDGLKDVVANAGLLFETGNVVELAQIIQKVMNSPKYYRQIGCACRKKARNYSIENMCIKYDEIYQL